MDNAFNPQLVLICGYSGTGKSASLRNIKDQSDWFYLNTEAGKRLPFKNKFKDLRIEDPLQIYEAFQVGIDNPKVKGIIVDSLTFMMDMYETQYVITSPNTQKAWGEFNQYFKNIMQQYVVKFNRPTIFTAHVQDVYDEKNLEMKTSVPIKGSLKGVGIEAYFSTIVSAKKISIKDLEPYKSSLLNITEQERNLGYKHVFQTSITKTTVGERIRSPMGMFTTDETYMDNDCQVLLNRLTEYYS